MKFQMTSSLIRGISFMKFNCQCTSQRVEHVEYETKFCKNNIIAKNNVRGPEWLSIEQS